MTVAQKPSEITPSPSLRRQIEELSGQTVAACFQCQKCTNGCPVTFAMDIMPHHLIRLLHLGMVEQALNSATIWVCASCETCTTRCPNNIDIAHLMDTLRQLSCQKGTKAPHRNVPIFHSTFLASIERHGRLHELEMAARYTLKTSGVAGLLKQAKQGLTMFSKGKLKLLPSSPRGKKQVKDIFRRTGDRGRC